MTKANDDILRAARRLRTCAGQLAQITIDDLRPGEVQGLNEIYLEMLGCAQTLESIACRGREKK